MNRLAALAALAFSITLALFIGYRLNDQSLAVITGAVIGVVASMPMTAVVLWLTLRNREPRHRGYAPPPAYAPREEPRMIVIQPQPYTSQYAPMAASPYLNAPMPLAAPYQRPQRDFKIVGQGETDDEDRDALV